MNGGYMWPTIRISEWGKWENSTACFGFFAYSSSTLIALIQSDNSNCHGSQLLILFCWSKFIYPVKLVEGGEEALWTTKDLEWPDPNAENKDASNGKADTQCGVVDRVID